MKNVGSKGCRLFAAAVLAMSAGTSLAGGICDSVFLPGLPDFDQKRSVLPNDGKMYCVPTAWTNTLGFLANNGYPDAMFGVWGPQDWQSQGMYGHATATISKMGMLLNTDPYKGTGGNIDGLVDYCASEVGGFLIFYSNYAKPGNAFGPSPANVAAMMSLGAVVNMNIGWMEWWTNHWERVGGHMVTVSRVLHAYSSPEIWWRDPVASDSLTMQSQFTNSISSAHPVPGFYSWKDDSTNYFGLCWQLDGYTGSTKGFLMGYTALWPNFGIGVDPVIGNVKLYFPLTWLRTDMKQSIEFHLPDAAKSMHDISFLPDMSAAIIAVMPTDQHPGQVQTVSLADGSVRVLHDLDGDPTGLAVDRFGNVIVGDGATVIKIKPDTGDVIGRVELPSRPAAIECDDSSDQVICVSDRLQDFHFIPSDFSRVQTKQYGGGGGTGKITMSFHPKTGKLWLSDESAKLFEITDLAAERLESAQHTLPGVKSVKSIQFNVGGEIIVYCDGSVREFTPSDAGGLIPTEKTGFDRAGFGELFKLGRTRDTFVGREGLEPELDIDVDGAGLTELADCPADFDGSGFADFDDFNAFVQSFEAGELRADFDYSGFTDFDDFNAFVRAFEEGC